MDAYSGPDKWLKGRVDEVKCEDYKKRKFMSINVALIHHLLKRKISNISPFTCSDQNGLSSGFYELINHPRTPLLDPNLW